MSLKLSLVSIEKDGCVRVASTGDLTIVDLRPTEKNPLETLLGAQWSTSRVLINLKKTRFIDSAAIGWLIASQREFRKMGGTFAIHSIEPRVRRMLEILRVEQIVALHNDESTARAYVMKSAVAA